jgi:hypothetical protein
MSVFTRRGTRTNGTRKRIWVQHVAVETDKLEMRVQAVRARGALTESQDIVAEGVFGFAQQALSRLLDKQAQTLLEGLPGGTDVELAPSVKEDLTTPNERATSA